MQTHFCAIIIIVSSHPFNLTKIILREYELYKITKIYELHLESYGYEWAKKIKDYYENRKIIDIVTSKIIIMLGKRKFHPISLFREINSELNLNLILRILMRLVVFYLEKITNLFIIVLKNPKKILKIKKYIK